MLRDGRGGRDRLPRRKPGLTPRVDTHRGGAREILAPSCSPPAHRVRRPLPVLHRSRTAGRTASGWSPRTTPYLELAVVRRPGLRGGRRRRPRHPGPGAAWEKAVTATSRGPVLDDQVDALHGARRAASRSTSTGSRSGAGRSAATSPRSPCCAGRTSSTRPSPARRSPTGGCTTRTTPSATSATRTSSPRSYARELARHRRRAVRPASRPDR